MKIIGLQHQEGCGLNNRFQVAENGSSDVTLCKRPESIMPHGLQPYTLWANFSVATNCPVH